MKTKHLYSRTSVWKFAIQFLVFQIYLVKSWIVLKRTSSLFPTFWPDSGNNLIWTNKFQHIINIQRTNLFFRYKQWYIGNTLLWLATSNLYSYTDINYYYLCSTQLITSPSNSTLLNSLTANTNNNYATKYRPHHLLPDHCNPPPSPLCQCHLTWQQPPPPIPHLLPHKNMLKLWILPLFLSAKFNYHVTCLKSSHVHPPPLWSLTIVNVWEVFWSKHKMSMATMTTKKTTTMEKSKCFKHPSL